MRDTEVMGKDGFHILNSWAAVGENSMKSTDKIEKGVLPVIYWMLLWAALWMISRLAYDLLFVQSVWRHFAISYAITGGGIGLIGGVIGVVVNREAEGWVNASIRWTMTFAVFGLIAGLVEGSLLSALFPTAIGAIGGAIGGIAYRHIDTLRISRKLLSIAPILLLSIIIVALTPGGRVLQDETVTIELVGSDHPDQLSYENEYVRIEVGCDQYLAHLGSVEESPREEWEKEREELIASIKETGSCSENNISLNEYSVAAILELGTATIYDKRSQSKVTSISVHTYGLLCGPLCGRGGRFFYLPDGTLFLDIEDWIA